MKKFAWVTDSTCGLSEQFMEEHCIYVIPLNVIVNDVSYKEDIEITKEQFYEKLKVHGEGAATSQPAFGEFVTLYEQLKKEYDGAIAIHASSALTGTYNSSKAAAKQTGFAVEVIDSKIGAYALGKMIKNGLTLQKNGYTYEEIIEVLKTYPDQTEMYLLPESLNQLKRSGRVTTTQAMFASLLKMNIILRFEDGKVIVEERIRGQLKAERRLKTIVSEAINHHKLQEICVMHAGVKERAFAWKEKFETLHDQLTVKIETLVPVAGVHTGFGTMAVAWLNDA